MFELSSQYLSAYASRVIFQPLIWPALAEKKVSVYLRRDDQASAFCPGNKFYKLFYNLQPLQQHPQSAAVSFGGAYSNHIHALALMGKQYNFSTVGIIRGHRPKRLSPTLADAEKYGMTLLFLDKINYREKNISIYEEWLRKKFSHYFIIPEGGENENGVRGCQEIGRAISQSFSGEYSVCCAVGTGTTLAGIVSGLPESKQCIGFSALKGDDTLSGVIDRYLTHFGCLHKEWQVVNDYHHGGYAKTTPELLQFMEQLERNNGCLFEPVYSAKMLWGIEKLAQQNFWKPGSRIIAVHGGGLQGRRGFKLD